MTYIREGMLPVYHVSDDGLRTRCGLAVLDTDISLATVADDVRRCVACQTVAAPGELEQAIAQVQFDQAVDEFDKESKNGNGVCRSAEVQLRGRCDSRRHRRPDGQRRHR